ncbi:hypothetical protein Bbelb_098510 [Branchiostoma belcheri]|nr:hypothetical protein Bbelb_098510 [Branchiostoma belcheri]
MGQRHVIDTNAPTGGFPHCQPISALLSLLTDQSALSFPSHQPISARFPAHARLDLKLSTSALPDVQHHHRRPLVNGNGPAFINAEPDEAVQQRPQVNGNGPAVINAEPDEEAVQQRPPVDRNGPADLIINAEPEDEEVVQQRPPVDENGPADINAEPDEEEVVQQRPPVDENGPADINAELDNDEMQQRHLPNGHLELQDDQEDEPHDGEAGEGAELEGGYQDGDPPAACKNVMKETGQDDNCCST